MASSAADLPQTDTDVRMRAETGGPDRPIVPVWCPANVSAAHTLHKHPFIGRAVLPVRAWLSIDSNLPSRSAFFDFFSMLPVSDLASTTKSAKQLMSWAYEQTNLGILLSAARWIFGTPEYFVHL